MNRIKPLRLVALTVAILTGSAGAASAYWSAWIGGPGGDFFIKTCSGFSTAPDTIIGFNVRAGAHIDAIQPLCWSGQSSAWFGGNGGSETQISCGYDGVSRAVRAYADPNWFVNAMQMFCRNDDTADEYYTHWAGTKTANYYSLRCAEWEAVTRVRGGAGGYLDSLSVNCESYLP